MSQNYSNSDLKQVETSEKTVGRCYKWWMILILPAWVFISFFVAQVLVIGFVHLLAVLNISITLLNESVANTLLSALMYTTMLVLIVGLPWLVRKQRVSREEVGITRLPTWTDILITPAGLILYLILSSVLIIIVTQLLSLFPGVETNQAQNIGFNHLSQSYQYLLAFTTLVIITPLAEEILFRGYLFGKLKKFVPVWVAILITSLLFGAVHGQWDLAIDTFALSVILCLLRQSTGNIWASILLHMTKNGIAFYILFINPLFLATLVK